MSGGEEVIVGWHAVAARLQRSPGSIRTLWLREDRLDKRAHTMREAAKAVDVSVRLVSAQMLDSRAGGLRHQGVLALVSASRQLEESDLWRLLDSLHHPPLLLALDQVQDPHNLGACLRSADGAGADAVIVPRARSAALTPAVRRIAAGAAERLPLIVAANLARCISLLRDRGIWVTGLAGDAPRSLYALDLRGPCLLVLGAEEGGLRRLTREHCDFLAGLPMNGSVESLNVSAAAAVSLYEARRQRDAG